LINKVIQKITSSIIIHMPHISIATPADIPQLVSLVNQAYRGDASRKGWTTEADLLSGPIRTNEANVLELMSKKDAVFLKYAPPGEAVRGCVFLEKRERGLYLGMLCVLPEAQGEGIGKQLLRAAETHARRMECPVIFMQVVSERPELNAWYERHGYNLTGERRPFDGDLNLGVPVKPLEFIIMEKRIGDGGTGIKE
jgi:ribosomal protein S18 acetylase RimI-like enzyme